MAEKRNNTVGPQVSRDAPKPDRKIAVALVFASITIGMTSATQMFAHDFAYQAGLGNSFYHLYAPWKILEWTMRYADSYPVMIKKAASVGIMVSAVLMMLTYLRLMLRSNSSKSHEFIHGSARWASKDDIKAAALLGGEGVYVGAWKDKGVVRYLGPSDTSISYGP